MNGAKVKKIILLLEWGRPFIFNEVDYRARNVKSHTIFLANM